MLSFTFGGKNSFTDYGIIVSSRPSIPSPKRRVSYINIPGRNSNLIFDEGTYDDITIVLECTSKDRNNLMDKMDNIKAWLFEAGESDLIFSFNPNKKYRAQVVNSIDFKTVFRCVLDFPIIFNCKPFKYLVENTLSTINQSATEVINSGNIESDPIISVYCLGDITLKINNEQIKLIDINGKVIINSEIQDCYDDEGNSLNEKMTGEFPKLKTGVNIIEWIGTVSKVEILPNWRWL
ncbi:distal tail protein Dit [Clostridium vincentii]|uniref:Phage tail protein n=1 Tax=Clostridium vincentii TaxID=52704 RepID=A0A2T0BKY2_9CLOT|nr:distal tail protein Dit [Clostridium vincentii]PRR84519.1 Phage tail protein [Clostridium vincentii]